MKRRRKVVARGGARQLMRKPSEITGSVSDYVRMLVAVLVLFVEQAAFPDSAVSSIVQVLVAGTALMLALGLADASRRTELIIGTIVAAALAGTIVQFALGSTDHSGGALLLVNVLLLAGGPVAMFIAIRQHPVVSIRTVIASITIYIMIGLFFAFLYRAFLAFDETVFTSGSGPLDPAAMQYLSFVTITTVGFGDIVPTGNLARTVVTLEALIGQIYLVTVVSLVVGNMGRTRQRRDEND